MLRLIRKLQFAINHIYNNNSSRIAKNNIYMNSFDYSRKYYKIIKENAEHDGLIYRLGLNIDPLEFEANGYSGAGIHFTDKHHIWNYLYWGNKIATINIPIHTEVYCVDATKGNKIWRSKKIVIEKLESFGDYLSDYDICIEAVKQNPNMLLYIEPERRTT